MKFDLEDLTVHFPYAAIYPEQHAYVDELKRALDVRSYTLLEMPTGTCKMAAVISFITSYSLPIPSRPLHLIYCTRTVHEMEMILAELRLLFTHVPAAASRSLLALGLSSRKNLCVHPKPPPPPPCDSVDTAYRRLTVS